MSKPSSRLGDIGSGHGKCSPTPVTSGSDDVMINGKPAARMGDSLAPHCKHGRSIGEGSSTVSINGKPAARVGDAIVCGGKLSTGSDNVTIGDTIVLTQPDDMSLPDIDFSHRRSGGASAIPARQQGDSIIAVETAKPDEHVPEELAKPEPELGPAIVRLAINPAANLLGDDQFVLTSTDGSITVTKTVANDLIPGDDFLDIQFDNLDKSLNYKLEHIDARSGETYTYFDDFSYGAIGVPSPLSDDDKDETEST